MAPLRKVSTVRSTEDAFETRSDNVFAQTSAYDLPAAAFTTLQGVRPKLVVQITDWLITLLCTMMKVETLQCLHRIL